MKFISESTGRLLASTVTACTTFRSLEEPWNRLIKTVKSYLLTGPCFSDGLDSLIGPSGLLLVVCHLFAVPVSVSWVGLEKKLVTKTLM
jgi:hypothetical protein